MNLKQQLISVLKAVGLVAGPVARSVVTLAVWAVEKWVPDSVEGKVLTFGAAPDTVKEFVQGLFDLGLSYIPSDYAKWLVKTAADVVMDKYLDAAWDALVKQVMFATAPEDESSTVAVLNASV